MKLQSHRQAKGSVLVVSLVVVALGTIGAAAFLSLISTKSLEAESREADLSRRVREANSRALARQALQRNYLAAATVTAEPTTFALYSGAGQATINPPANPPLSETAFVRLNRTGAISLEAYSTDLSLSLSSGEGEAHAYQAQAKSRHPIHGDDLLWIHLHPNAASYPISLRGNLIIEGRLTLGDTSYDAATGNGSGVKAKALRVVNSQNPSFSLADLEGKPLSPQNFGGIPTTHGVESGTADFTERLRVFDNPESPENSYLHRVANEPDVISVSGSVPVNFFDDSTGDNSTGSSGYSLVPPPGAPFNPRVNPLLCQAYQAHRLLLSAAYTAYSLRTTVNFRYSDMTFGTPSLASWWNDEKTFDGRDRSGLNSDLTSGIDQLRSDLSNAMSDNGGPDPYRGGWWPPAFPDFSDTQFWSTNNPYLGTGGEAVGWETAMVGSNGQGSIQIDLGNPSLPNVHVTSNVRRLILTGQTSAAEIELARNSPPVLIVVEASPGGGGSSGTSVETLLECANFTGSSGSSHTLEGIELRGQNFRPHILAIRKSDPENPVTVTNPGPSNFPEWHGVWELQSTPVIFDLSAVVEATYAGSIRTDSSFEIDQGTLILTPEINPDNLSPLASRNAWLELFKIP